MDSNNMAVVDCRECRAGAAQLAHMDLAFRCPDHGLIRVDVLALGAELARLHAENAALQAEITRLRAEGCYCATCRAAPGESCTCPGRGV